MPQRLLLCFALFLSVTLTAQGQAWINELHYDNTGGDTGEFIEVAGVAGTDLTGWSLALYNGDGSATYDTEPLAGTIPDQGGGFGTLSFAIAPIQNGAPDGLALCDGGGVVVSGTTTQFLSYEGVITASGGCADGLTSTDIGVDEDPAPPIGSSLGLEGTGTTYDDFTWTTFADDSPGAVNAGQSFGVGPLPTTDAGIWFNEAHYQDTDAVTTTFLELVADGGGLGPAMGVLPERPDATFGKTSSPAPVVPGVSVVLYEAATGMIATLPPALGGGPAILPLGFFTPGETIGDFTFLTFGGDTEFLFAAAGDALALCFDLGLPGEAILESGGAVQFFSQLGTTTAAVGCAAGRTSTDLGVSEDTSTLPGASIGLTDGPGAGMDFGDFVPTTFPNTDIPRATPGSPNFYQSFAITNECPAPFGIDDFKSGPNNKEFVSFLTNPATDLTSPQLYLVMYDGATGDAYFSTTLDGTTDGAGGYVIGAKKVTPRDQDLPPGTIQPGPDGIAVLTRDVPLGSSVYTLTFPNEVCAYLYYQNKTTILVNYGTPGPTKKPSDSGFDLLAFLTAQQQQEAPLALLEEDTATLPTNFTLDQNYPNPFNPTTAIQFALPEAADVSLVVYDMLGRAVQELVARPMEAGSYTVSFDAQGLPSGMYIYRLTAGGFSQTKRMVLLK